MNTKILLNNIAEKAEHCLKEIYTLKNEKSALENEIKDLIEDIHKANNTLQKNDIEIKSLNRVNNDLENEISKLKADISNLKADIFKISNELKDRDEKIFQLSNKLEEIKKIKADIETKNDDLINENESGKKLIKEYELEIQRLKDFFEHKKKIVTKKKL